MKSIFNGYSSLTLFFCLSLIFASCGSIDNQNIAANTEQSATVATPAEETPPTDVDEAFLERIRNEKWSGDIDGMLQRRYIRALVFYNKTDFFFDGPQPRGITYDALK